MTTDQPTPEEVLAIDCQGLTYAFAEGLESALDGVDLSLKKGDRCLLVGANGGTSYSRFNDRLPIFGSHTTSNPYLLITHDASSVPSLYENTGTLVRWCTGALDNLTGQRVLDVLSLES